RTYVLRKSKDLGPRALKSSHARSKSDRNEVAAWRWASSCWVFSAWPVSSVAEDGSVSSSHRTLWDPGTSDPATASRSAVTDPERHTGLAATGVARKV